jgi:ABC-2 type transport system permease protein
MTYAIGLARAGVELKTFYRERDQLVFTFALPIVLLLLLGSVFRNVYEGTTVTSAHYMVPSMMAAGVASATFLNLGISIATDRENGTLKRLRGLPMSMISYVMGKVAVVLVVAAVQIVLMLAIGVSLFDLPLPTDGGRWFTFAWVLLLGTVACSLLGVAASQVAMSAASAGTAMNMLHLVLAFLSGIYFTPIAVLPNALATVGSFFPLKWMGQGFRSALLPDSILSVEMTNSWEHGRTALVLAAWCVGGVLLCLFALRWRARRDG